MPAPRQPPNTALELTPQSGLKIVVILRIRSGPSAFLFYQCGAAQRQAVRPL
jgi:hypothetical protein